MQVSSDEDAKDNNTHQQPSHSKQTSLATKFDHSTCSTLDTASCSVPVSYAGYLLKNRKSPMKGWHKVSFFFVSAIL